MSKLDKKIVKKICIVSKSFWEENQGGAEYQLNLLSIDLVKRGYEVHYVYLGQNAPSIHNGLSLHPIRIRRLIKRYLYPYQSFACFELLKALEEIKPDIIINRRGDALTGFCAYYAKRNICKMIWHIADEPDVKRFRFILQLSLPILFIDKKILEYGIRNSDFIIGQAKYQNTLLEKHYTRKCDQIVFNFHPLPKQPHCKPKNLQIVWIANIKEKKNPKIFVNLAKHFESNSNIHFFMIGKCGPPDMQNEIDAQSKGSKNFTFLGEMSQEKVNNFLNESHIFVNTSSYEGFPNTFIQAWMRHMPVVSLHVDPDDVLERKKIGFHSHTITNMINNISSLVQNPELLKAYGARAFDYASTNHLLEPNIDKIEKLFEHT